MMQRYALQLDDNLLQFCDYGGHILSWHCQGRERLFLSQKAKFEAGTAIRGGIPIIFPQFSNRGPLPRHGFARTQYWQVLQCEGAQAHLRLRDNAQTKKILPQAFVADLFIELKPSQLQLTLQITNSGDDVFDFTSALHSYLAVSDIATVQVSGLQTCSYEDALSKKRRLADDDVLRFEREVDRIYQCNQTVLHDGEQQLQLHGDGFDDSVIWNPHAATTATINDLGADEWRRFVCIEAANVMTKIVLPPGAQSSASHTLTVV